eukprot:Plantae.Rhodophyta-Purpureofilum_apyrenoidigerum.ctg17762.p2 GENE.Plantae.Rhodophyta-Purpureofilum_apyrenoidigerum.ctg17762~~Plantae.Rhodophyta-Purpureofilum_apyrenoidigerum.ctg17762.p2  ORF type:complete len:172 (-),score=21.50 Plantae.Rhodophyta-Purpureofilum_apyrenoidigerum.ctg17762:194-709(-)
MSANEERQLRVWFDTIDNNRNGSLEVDELARALAQAGLDLSVSACALLIRMHDFDRNGTVTFNEFVSIHRFILSVRESFIRVDRNRDHVLRLDEVQEALQFNNFTLDRGALAAVFRSFDPMQRQYLTLPDFIALAAFLSTARHLFGQYDRNNCGQVNLNFDAFCWIIGNLR